MSTPDKDGQGYPGQAGLWASTSSSFNNQTFLVEQLLALIRTATLVQVQKCTNNGELAAVGTVDVLPLVNMTDGLNNGSEHGTLYKLPYCRVQGGVNAIIIDPKPGDIGVAVFADRDISVVKKTKKRANPSIRRRHSMADGIYLFGVLNAVPTQYIRFSDDGIEIIDKNGNKIQMTSAGIKFTDCNSQTMEMKAGSIAMTTDLLSNTKAIKAGLGGADEVGVQTHRHSGVTTGGGSTAAPTAGT